MASTNEIIDPAAAKATLPVATAPGIAPAMLLLPSWLGVVWFISKASWFWNHHPNLKFGWTVPLLAAFLLWERWEKKPAIQPGLTVGVLVAGLGGFGLLFCVQIYQ